MSYNKQEIQLNCLQGEVKILTGGNALFAATQTKVSPRAKADPVRFRNRR
jgi:hypothetical protein